LNYVSSYIDLPNSPKFPFGYGLSYTTFSYGDIKLSTASFKPGQTLTASIVVTNTGKYDGIETVQLYTRDLVGSVVRPVKELKGFQRVSLKAGQSKTITFTISANDLKFYNNKLEYNYEPGDFKIFIGTNSRDVKEAAFTLVK
jgi:beta-glucosidase